MREHRQPRNLVAKYNREVNRHKVIPTAKLYKRKDRNNTKYEELI